MAANPYSDLPDSAFWRRSVSRQPRDVDPIVTPKFVIPRNAKIATAGSCFAQHISRTLVGNGFNYLVTETGPQDRNFGVFSARYGNIYTIRQLNQLLRRCYSLFEPVDDIWETPAGRYIDPFRPLAEPGGFGTVDELRRDRDAHFAATRTMFEGADVFIFTLGLTEGWVSIADGAVYPFAPGVMANSPEGANIAFHNFSVAEMTDDLRAFIADVRRLRPSIRFILTVSPVPLIATYEARHVLVSTVYSKSALRVVADELCKNDPDVEYFPSFEIVAGHQSRGAFFADDMREVSAEGVDHVMGIFTRHYLTQAADGPSQDPVSPSVAQPRQAGPAGADIDSLMGIICDEEILDR
jgi:hypothetical protein